MFLKVFKRDLKQNINAILYVLLILYFSRAENSNIASLELKYIETEAIFVTCLNQPTLTLF